MSDRRHEALADRTSTTQSKSVAACPTEEELAVLLDASAAAALVPQLLAHLDVCDDCRSVAAALARTTGDSLGTVPSLPIAPRVDPGSAVDRYVILHRLGAGGMGTVYAAYDPVLDRKVAIKFVRSSPHESRYVRVAEAQRVAREALTLARLSHPNIVAVFDAGYYNELAYIVMEHVDGYTLRGWLEAGRRTGDEIARVIGEAAAGLRAIHGAGLVHRDMKPENVMVDTAGRVHVTDFGLARGSTFQANEPAELAGTVVYMSPEQLRGERADALSDIFSFGVTAYEALHATRPFPHARSPRELLAAIREGRPERGRKRRDVPRPLARAVLKCLSFDSARRQGALADVASSFAFALPGRLLAFGAIGMVAVVGNADVRKELESALATARELHDPFAEGSALTMLAQLQGHAGELAAAETSLVDAVFASERGGDPAAGAIAWTSLAELAGHDQVHASEAARDALHAESLLSRANAPLLRAKLVRARADTALEESSFDAAAVLYRQALDLLAASGRRESLDAAACLDGLGWVLSEGGKPGEGRVAASSSLAMAERLFGPRSPVVASGLANLARIDASEEHYGDAEARLVRALEIYRVLGESEHAHIANITNSLGEVAAATGRLNEARALFEQNAVRYGQELGDHRLTAMSVANVAEVDLSLKRYEDASRGFQEARAILARAGSTDPNAEAQVSVGGGRAEMGLGHLAAAQAAIERALAIYDSGSFGPAEHGSACLAMAHVAFARGDRARAGSLTEKARDLYLSVPAHSKELAEADALLATLAKLGLLGR